MTTVSINYNIPADINLPYPTSSTLQDTQEFERKKTMSGYIEKPKNRFSENKKWTFTFEMMTQDQLASLESVAASSSFQIRDPLGRMCILKPVDFRPSHMNRMTVGEDSLLSSAVIEGLVINANHNLYAPGGKSITTPANSPAQMPTLTGDINKSPCTGGNEKPFGPVLVYELDNPPANWNRSARVIQSGGGSGGAVLSSPILAEEAGSIFLAFETQSEE